MMFISFSKTEREYRTGNKRVTRRDWKLTHLARWQRVWDEGRLVHDAWTALPFVPGAERIGQFKLTRRPYRQRLEEMTALDLFEEGDMCRTVDEFCRLIGKRPADVVTVVWFEPVQKGGEDGERVHAGSG